MYNVSMIDIGDNKVKYVFDNGHYEVGEHIRKPSDFLIDREFYVINGDWRGIVTLEDGELYMNILTVEEPRKISEGLSIDLAIRYVDIYVKTENEKLLDKKKLELAKLEDEINDLELLIEHEHIIRENFKIIEEDDNIPF